MPDVVGTLKPPRLATAPSAPVLGQVYYNTTANILYWWNGTAWVSASAGTATIDLVYKGDFAAGSYSDGDIVVSGGITWMCVRPTSAAPSGWTLGQGVPQPIVNGQWLKGAGGAAVWSPIIETDVRGLVVADTAWHNINAAGEPAYMNGWNTYGGEWGGARFRKLSSGMVAVNGLIQGGTIGQPAFYLPVGYRPIGQSELCSTDSGGVHSRVDYGTDGRCTPLSGTNGYFSIHANFYTG